MERMLLNEQTAQNNPERFTRFDRVMSKERRSFHLFFLRSVYLSFCVGGLGVLGCNSFELMNANRYELSRGEYVIHDKDAAATWSEAATNVPLQKGESRFSAKKPLTPSVGLGQAPLIEESESFSEKVMNVFRSKRVPKTNADGAYRTNTTRFESDDEPVHSYYSQNVYPDSSRERLNSTEDHKPGFWSKLFSTNRASAVSNASGGDNYIVNQTPPRAGVLVSGAYVNSRKHAGTETQDFTRTSGGYKEAPSRLTNDTVINRSIHFSEKTMIDGYDQSRFLPAFSDIEKYYYPRSRRVIDSSGVTVAPSATVQSHLSSAKSTSSKLVGGRGLENNSSVSSSGRFSAYGAAYENVGAARTISNASEAVDSAPVTNITASRKSGGAFLSPIVHADASILNSREGGVGGRSLGVTRKFKPETLEDVSQVSYAEQLRSLEEKSLSPESLFGWDDNVACLLDAFQPVELARSDEREKTTPCVSDSDFMSSLGKQVDRSWLERSISGTTKSVEETDVSQLDEENSDEQAINATTVLTSDVEDRENVEFEPEASSNTIVSHLPRDLSRVVDPNASLDDIFDATVASNSNFSVDTPETKEYQESNVDTRVEEDNALADLKSNDDFNDFPKVDEDLGASSPDDASVQCAEPLSEADVCVFDNSDGDFQKEFLNQASEVTENVPTPGFLDERKKAQAIVPLTLEEVAWVEQVKNAIQALLRERETLVERGGNVHSCDARLRLLYLVIGEYDRAIQDIQDDSDPLKIFWEKECRGLETLLQNRLEEIDPSFVADRLRSGLDSLASLCPLKIRKALLVVEPACYGLYEERGCDYNEGDVIYAYTELDYVTCRESVKGYRIDVECRWRLLDSYGNVVIPFESQRCSNVSETKLRDVVLNVSIPLLDKMEVGKYVLELEVVDINATEPTTSVKRLELSVGLNDSV